MNLKITNVPRAEWMAAARIAELFSATYSRAKHTGLYHCVGYVDRTGKRPVLWVHYTKAGAVVVRANSPEANDNQLRKDTA